MNIHRHVFESRLLLKKDVRKALQTGWTFGLSAVVCLSGALVQGQGQDPQRKSIEIYRGVNRTESSTVIAPTPPPPRIPRLTGGLATPATVSALAPLPPLAVEMATVLAQQSTDAFERGLLPLEDYLEHLRFVTYVEQRTAAEHHRPQGVIRAAQQHVNRLHHAAELLAEFRQPAAEGWAADTFLAQAVTAEAQANLDRLKGNQEEAGIAMQRFQELTIKHLEAREFDTEELGIGSLPTMAAAIELVRRANSEPDTNGVVAETRENILLTLQRWHAAGAGIGRIDEVERARVAEAESRGKWAIISQGMPQFATAVREAEQAARELYDSEREFYDVGTASLADLTQALLIRNRVHQLAATQKDLITPEMDAAWERDLHEVVALSEAIEDHRGRNAPDIQFVALLNLVDATNHTPVPNH